MGDGREILSHPDCLAASPGPAAVAAAAAEKDSASVAATKKSSFGAAINAVRPAPSLSPAHEAATVVVDARFYLSGNKAGGAAAGECVGFICGLSLRNQHHSRFSSRHTG